MLPYLFELMNYMQENGCEDFANPGVDHKTIDNIVKAIRQIVLNREAVPVRHDYEYEEEEPDTLESEEYQIELPDGIKLKCEIEYHLFKRSKLYFPNDTSTSWIYVFKEVRDVKAYDSMGNPVPIFDAEGITNLVCGELRVVFEGETVQKSQLCYASNFSEGLAVVCYKKKVIKMEVHEDSEAKGHDTITSTEHIIKYTYINQQGELAFPDKWFDEADDFANGVAKVKIGEECFCIDHNGIEINGTRHHEAEKMTKYISSYIIDNGNDQNDFGAFSDIDIYEPPFGFLENDEDDSPDKLCIIAPDGSRHPIEVEIEGKFNVFLDNYSEGLLILLGDDPDYMLDPWVSSAEPIGCCIDCHGKVRYWFNPCKKLPIYGYSEGYAIFHDFGWWYNPQKDPRYIFSDEIDVDTYYCSRFRGYSYVDTEGNVAFGGMQYDTALPFVGGMARVAMYGRSLLIDKEGRVVF